MDLKTGNNLTGDDLNHHLNQNKSSQKYFNWTFLENDKSLYLNQRYVILNNVVYEILDTVKGEYGFVCKPSTVPITVIGLPDLTTILGYQVALE